jgi:hypothetical protein
MTIHCCAFESLTEEKRDEKKTEDRSEDEDEPLAAYHHALWKILHTLQQFSSSLGDKLDQDCFHNRNKTKILLGIMILPLEIKISSDCDELSVEW